MAGGVLDAAPLFSGVAGGGEAGLAGRRSLPGPAPAGGGGGAAGPAAKLCPRGTYPMAGV
ncbi:MAG: hypothetical protein FJ128_03495 [Deltaproteobacteria bacterium]|nr:hypothetical protein [Deltaproteobacteria bacterium]